MKKQTKIFAILSVSAMMTAVIPFAFSSIGGSTTVYAASQGWVEENNTWRYYDANGYYLTDTWKKQGNDWYYLNVDGNVSTDIRIEDYYVDDTGKRVINTWIPMENEDYYQGPDTPEYFWTYFGKDGKIQTSKWQIIDGNHYYFNEDGHMQTGKVQIDGATYYLGTSEDGVMKTGWIELDEALDNPDSEASWYYFENNGKMVENQIDKKIGNSYYTFVNGKMQTGWFQLPETATSSDSTMKTIADYQYYHEEDGSRASGWEELEGVPGISEEGRPYYFYFKNGKAHHATDGIQLVTIGSERYGFNEKGEMQTGLQVANLDDGEIAHFYFGEDGAMKTGKLTIYNEDLGEDEAWSFYTEGSRKGQGVHGIRDNSIYVYGLRQEADADLRIAPINFADTNYLVHANGVIQKATVGSKSASRPELGTGYKDFKDENEKVWTVNVSGVIYE